MQFCPARTLRGRFLFFLFSLQFAVCSLQIIVLILSDEKGRRGEGKEGSEKSNYFGFVCFRAERTELN